MRSVDRMKLLLGVLPAVPVVTAGAAGLRYTARAAAARRNGTSLEPGVPTPEPSVGLAGAVALDTFITQPMSLLASMGSAAALRPFVGRAGRGRPVL